MSEPSKNRLKNSVSPYLRGAAGQPVDWHEWGEEAFAKARAEGKPILLDIGAAWCHWCHVIDRESYENPEIAAVINENYVPVKVDRDERPDVDARYQAAVSAISGQGGWPLTAFLTGDGKPFFGGTYFPPEDAMGRPGFKRILRAIAEAFRARPGEVENSARAVEEALAQAESFEGARGDWEPRLADAIADSIVRMFDLRHGGFGRAPKFPHPCAIDLLLERYQARGETSLLTVAETTLEKMALGGVYDQLAGGFHRYSVDERWGVPHFEKMSYDNSELLKNYLHGYQITGKPLFRGIVEGIISWVFETLSDPLRGGFYGSQDADYSLEDDGDYFTWTKEEVQTVLTSEEVQVVELYYDVSAFGEMHHNPAKNVLWVAMTPAEVAAKTGISEEEVRRTLGSAKAKLLSARRRRPTPAVDATLYVGWNAMFVSAFLEAARVLGRADCRTLGLKTLARILAEGWDESRGFAHRIGGTRLEGTLDDQVFSAAALLDAYEATLERRYLASGERAMQLTIEKFGDVEGGGFFDRARDALALGGLDIRRKPLQDSATPGTNSIAAVVLDRLFALTGCPLYREWSQKTLEGFARIAPQLGLFAASYGLASVLHARHPLQVVITGEANDPHAAALERAAEGVYRFGKSVLRITPERLAADGLAPALRETLTFIRADVAQALVCIEPACQPPLTDPARLSEVLAHISGSAAEGRAL